MYILQDQEDSNALLIEKISYCAHEMETYWTIALCIYKGFIVSFWLVVAWKTQFILDPILCDAKYSGWCIFNIAILGIVALPIQQNLPRELETTKIVIESSVIVSVFLISQGIVFIQKVS